MGKKAGINETAKAFCLSKHFLYTQARAKKIPHIKSGNRYIFDWGILEEFLKKEALGNVKREENSSSYGKLRKIIP